MQQVAASVNKICLFHHQTFVCHQMFVSRIDFKKAVSWDFLQFFFSSSIECIWSVINILKWFCWKIRFREDIHEICDSAQCDTAPSQTPRSITLRRVRLRAVSHCAESGNWNVRKSKIVSHCAESDSAQCDTAQSQTILFSVQFSVAKPPLFWAAAEIRGSRAALKRHIWLLALTNNKIGYGAALKVESAAPQH